MLTDRERLARHRAHPRLVELHRALSRLTSVLTVMNSGAHPDDEHSGMLAALRFERGLRVVIACSTRGEGGQNSLGPEQGGALGVLRTRELEEAARLLDADLAWLGFGPDDPVHDFGFSKDGVDTLARWGRERLLERIVRAYRRERPDIVIPTFLDVPGQHGHHRAMTEAAEAAIALAANPEAFPEHLAEGLTPWRVAKFYLPAWSGGGGTYDDELPPPNASVEIAAPRRDPATGAAFAEIGEWSRAFHASQGMGHWTPVPRTIWPLHLQLGGEGVESDILAGLPATLTALGTELGAPVGSALAAADTAVDSAISSFPDRDAIISALTAAAAQLASAAAGLTEAQADRHGHRLARKQAEVDAALLCAAGVVATAWIEPALVTPDSRATLCVHIDASKESAAAFELRLPDFVTAGAPVFADGISRVPLQIAADAPVTPPFVPSFSNRGGNGVFGLDLMATIAGHLVRAPHDLEEPLAVVPRHSASLDPEALVLPLGRLPAALDVGLRLEGPPAPATLEACPGVEVERTATGFRITPNPDITPGRYTLPLRVDGASAQQVQPVAYPHIGRTRHILPQALDLLVLDLALPPGVRVGYVGGGSDNVGSWLARMGLEVTALDAAALAGDLTGYDSIVIGVFAFGLRPDLVMATEKLHHWVESGGHLLTLYHRPTDGWDPDRVPPRRLVIGTPSLRWRVTNPDADVQILAADHPLLSGPNTIGAADWAGWDKERGLYFASEWDPAYVPLLSMHDANEPPLRGALLSAPIGEGRHTHTSLVLHHQLNKLVPGAFRLLANLVQPAGKSTSTDGKSGPL